MAYPNSGGRSTYVGTEVAGDVLTKANFDKGPGGAVAYAQITADSTLQAATASVSGLSVTITAGSQRFYKITCSFWAISQNGTGTTSVEIWDMNATLSLGGIACSLAQNSANPFPGGTLTVYHQPSAGSQVYTVRTSCNATNAQINAAPSGGNSRAAILLVEDWGSAF